MKKYLYILGLSLAVGVTGCVSDTRTVEHDIDEPAGSSTTIIDTDEDMDHDIDVDADLDVPDVDVDADADNGKLEIDAEIDE